MKTFFQAGDFTYHIDTKRVPVTNQYHVSIYSQVGSARDGDYKRMLLNLNLTKDELSVVVDELKALLES
jgi:hypothetical protein